MVDAGCPILGVYIRTVTNTPLDIPEGAEVEEMLNESEARSELRLPMITQICTEHSYKNTRIRLVCKNDARFYFSFTEACGAYFFHIHVHGGAHSLSCYLHQAKFA